MLSSQNIKIDIEKCIGCGTCAALAPGTFKMNDQMKAEVLDVVTDDEATIQSARDCCPVQVITIE